MTKATVKAVEEKQSSKGRTYWRIQLQPGGWGSSFNPKVGKVCSENIGRELDLTTSQNGQYLNVDDVVAPPAGSTSGGGTDRDHLIVRQVALKAAVELAVSSQTTDTGWIFATAGSFVDWINGASEPPEPDETPY